MIPALIDDLLAGRPADPARLRRAFDLALAGEVADAALAGLLVALRACPTTPELLATAAASARAHQRSLEVERRPLVDTCGTGGDGAGTFNVSTAAALVAAACGVAVAKHGNRSVSSKSGSADVLEALGLPLDLSAEATAGLLEATGFGFLFAPLYHPVMARVAPVRRALGVRTLFNLLGPLLNPAGAPRQVIGVYAPELTEVVARALAALGSERALVLHCGGLDELALHAPTVGHRLADGRIEPFALDPRDLGLEPAPVEALAADGAGASAARVRAVLDGTPGPAFEVTALNAGAALWIGGCEASLEAGYRRARRALVDGEARATLDAVVARARAAADGEAA